MKGGGGGGSIGGGNASMDVERWGDDVEDDGLISKNVLGLTGFGYEFERWYAFGVSKEGGPGSVRSGDGPLLAGGVLTLGPGEYEVGFWLIVRLRVFIAGLAIQTKQKLKFEEKYFF